MKKHTCIGLFFLIVHYIIVVLNTKIYDGVGINLYFYYPFSIIYMTLITDFKDQIIDALKKNKRYVLFILNLWTLIVGISIFLPGCYYVKEGGTVFFGSFVATIFRLGPAAVFIISLIAISMVVYNRKKDIIYAIVPMYCFFMGSSRTYLLVGILLFIVLWYWYCKKNIYFIISMIPISVAIISMIFYSAIGDKIIYSLDENLYGDFWFRFTSSRSEIWTKNILEWMNQPWYNKILGSGFFFSYYVTGLWSHNDFIELICSVGIFGLIYYLYYHITMIKKCLNTQKKIPFVIAFAAVFSWFANAFLNMYYVYFCALLAFPILLLAIRYYYSENN